MLRWLLVVVPMCVVVPVNAQNIGQIGTEVVAKPDSIINESRFLAGVNPSGYPADTLFKDIAFTPAQEAKVNALKSAYKTRLRARMVAFVKSGETKQLLKQRNEIPDLRSLHRAYFAELRAVLDTAQQRAFDKNVKSQTDEVPRLIKPWPDKKKHVPKRTNSPQTNTAPTTNNVPGN